jgi:hypothetical protein
MKGEIRIGGEYGRAVNWVFYFKPEDETERLALEYLKDRPKCNYDVEISELGVFIPIEQTIYDKAKQDYINQCQVNRVREIK